MVVTYWRQEAFGQFLSASDFGGGGVGGVGDENGSVARPEVAHLGDRDESAEAEVTACLGGEAAVLVSRAEAVAPEPTGQYG